MTAHRIDNDWKLYFRPLGLFLHEGTTKSTDVIVEEFAIRTTEAIAKEATIFAVTTDTDPTMNKFGMLLSKKENTTSLLYGPCVSSDM